jgi:hypothetical protein
MAKIHGDLQQIFFIKNNLINSSFFTKLKNNIFKFPKKRNFNSYIILHTYLLDAAVDKI